MTFCILPWHFLAPYLRLLKFTRLFGVSVALLSFWWAFQLNVPANIPRAQLFPLGMLLGFSAGSLMANTLCVLDPSLHLGVLVLGLLYLLHKFFLVDAPPLASPAVDTVTFVDAATQVQSILAPPVPMQVPVYPYTLLPRPMSNPLLVQPVPAGCPLLPFHAQPLPHKLMFLPPAPAVLLPRPLLLPPKPWPCLPILLMLRCMIPFLDSYKVIYTMKGFYAQRTFTAGILDWHVAYI